MRKVFTLAIVHADGRILLGKKLQKIGAGLWNGFGGKVESGEVILDAAIRECQEEVGITPSAITWQGILYFHYPDEPLGASEHEVHVFSVTKFSGRPKATPEMDAPTWFSQAEIPYDSMWADDVFWLPLLLAGKSFAGKFVFDMQGRIVEQYLTEVKNVANAFTDRIIS